MFIAGLLRYAARDEPSVRAGLLLHRPPRLRGPGRGRRGPHRLDRVRLRGRHGRQVAKADEPHDWAGAPSGNERKETPNFVQEHLQRARLREHRVHSGRVAL
jgi:hypothetical protein